VLGINSEGCDFSTELGISSERCDFSTDHLCISGCSWSLGKAELQQCYREYLASHSVWASLNRLRTVIGVPLCFAIQILTFLQVADVKEQVQSHTERSVLAAQLWT